MREIDNILNIVKEKKLSWQELLLSINDNSNNHLIKNIDKHYIINNFYEILKKNILDKNNQYIEFALFDIKKNNNFKYDGFILTLWSILISNLNTNKIVLNKNENNETMLHYIYGDFFKYTGYNKTKLISLNILKDLEEINKELLTEKNKNGLSLLDIMMQNCDSCHALYYYLYKKNNEAKANLLNNLRDTQFNYQVKEILKKVINIRGNSPFTIEYNKNNGENYKESFFDYLYNDYINKTINHQSSLHKLIVIVEHLNQKAKKEYKNILNNNPADVIKKLTYLKEDLKFLSSSSALKDVKKIDDLIIKIEKYYLESTFKNNVLENKEKKFKI